MVFSGVVNETFAEIFLLSKAMRMTVFWKRLGRAGGRPQSLISSARRLGRPWKTGSSKKG